MLEEDDDGGGLVFVLCRSVIISFCLMYYNKNAEFYSPPRFRKLRSREGRRKGKPASKTKFIRLAYFSLKCRNVTS
jgi:hypothetical protein